jgi:D-3-phosphoglycerate dehydrogenase / 2-oxoglutarate reductase
VTVLVTTERFTLDELRDFDVVYEPGPDVEAVLLMREIAFGASEMDAVPSARAIVTASIGYDHVDVAAAAARGIWVCNVPDYCIDEVADHTLALLLALARGVVALDHDVRGGNWSPFAAGPLRTLAGLRVGIVGYGRIGSAAGRRLTALGCKVAVNDVRDVGVPLVALDELLATSDAVTLHVPLTAQTTGLIGAGELARMRPDALLVNTSRGPVVELDALLAALREGRLGGAALDVLPDEPPPEAPGLSNLIVTPHAAWYSEDADRRRHAGAIEAVRTALRGERPASAVPETP